MSKTPRRCGSVKQLAGPLAMLLGCGISTANAAVDTLFHENFEGYSVFNDYIPSGDPVNAGIAKLTEGAAETWYGARFESPSNGTINSDLAIQKVGGGSNTSHTGRTEDDAGMVFKISATGYSGITLSFDWRTFLADTGDRFVVGYHVGPISEFGSCDGNGSSGCFADLQSGANSWTNGWIELQRDSKSNSWNSESYELTAAEGQSEVWIAFWLDNGEGDYAKFDNVLVTGTVSAPVPEAGTYAMMLAGLGLVGFAASRRNRIKQA